MSGNSNPLFIGGIAPSLCLGAELGPPRTECAPGALFNWADRLWAVTYVSHKSTSGVGTGLYEIFPDMTMVKRPESVVGTYTNRMAHTESNQLFIGPHAIDGERDEGVRPRHSTRERYGTRYQEKSGNQAQPREEMLQITGSHGSVTGFGHSE